MRGETSPASSRLRQDYFNPLSPCGERRESLLACTGIHFNPLSPCGGRDVQSQAILTSMHISIHSPHAGRDLWCSFRLRSASHFNPLSPCGERRHAAHCMPVSAGNFNPLSPCGERLAMLTGYPRLEFQSTLPHAGRDKSGLQQFGHAFQSTLPMRGETALHSS